VLDLPDTFKKQIIEALKERRVVQHVPADMSGARLEMNTWRVVKVESGKVTLRQRTFAPKDVDSETGARARRWKPDEIVDESRVLGLRPGKLKALSGALVIAENYGVVVLPEPVMIPFHNVKERMADVAAQNNGNLPLVIRSGMLIRVPDGDFKGVWRVRACMKDSTKGILFDLSLADRVEYRAKGVPWCRRDVRLKSLLKAGMVRVDTGYCGSPS
jgi:CRISPR-associated endonuclease Csn1